MLRTVALLAALASASGATISSVTCNGVSITGLGSLSCGSPNFTTPSFASAAISGLFVTATVGAQLLNDVAGSAAASASINGTFSFTVDGGTGGGFFLPCLFAGRDSSPRASGSGSALFGPFSASPVGKGVVNMCQGTPPFATGRAFVFGVPQIFELSIGASASGAVAPSMPLFVAASGEAGFGLTGSPFLFWDAAGNPLSNVTYTLTEAVPEPYSFWLCLTLLVAVCGASVSEFGKVTSRGSRHF